MCGEVFIKMTYEEDFYEEASEVSERYGDHTIKAVFYLVYYGIRTILKAIRNK